MSTKSESRLDNTRCQLVSGDDVSFLEGKLKTIVDAVIPRNEIDPSVEPQNQAVKDIIQTTLWDWFNFITDYETDHLKEKKDWYSKNRS